MSFPSAAMLFQPAARNLQRIGIINSGMLSKISQMNNLNIKSPPSIAGFRLKATMDDVTPNRLYMGSFSEILYPPGQFFGSVGGFQPF
jgi:hypothetical protein